MIQQSFVVEEFSLEQLSQMKTATSNAQTPLNEKKVEKLVVDLELNPQITPFCVVRLQEDTYLVSGRHRLEAHKRLKREAGQHFSCLVYTCNSLADVSRYIIQSNATRTTSAVESASLTLSGKYDKHIGKDDLQPVYEDLIVSNSSKAELKNLIITEVVAKASSGCSVTPLLLKQVLHGYWRQTIDRAEFKVWYDALLQSKNVSALVAFLVERISSTINATCKKHEGKITNWGRHKDTLIRECVLATKADLMQLYTPVKPSTTTKKTSQKTKKTLTTTKEV